MIVSGKAAFDLYDREGIPLDVTLAGGLALDVQGFAQAARHAGWTERRIRALLVDEHGNRHPWAVRTANEIPE